MNVEELKSIMADTETFRIEKTISTTNIDKFSQAICAFANDMPNSREFGYLLLGVQDDGSLSGLRADDELLLRLASLRTNGSILPIPSMTVEHVSFDDGDVVVVKVAPSMEPPVRYNGRCYIRIGPRKDIATPEEEAILSEKRQVYNRSFDMHPCREASIDDIDLTLFTSDYLPKAVASDVLSGESRSIRDQLSSLRLFDKKYDCPTNAAILLFGKNPRYYFPGAYIQHVQFDGVDNAAEIVNQNEFSGNLLVMLPRLEAFVETAIVQKRPSPVSVLQERMLADYPKWAIRELLMNAVMHRDYNSNTPTKFYQYQNRLEIVNPGGLYGNARPENFPFVNDYRNPIIAEALKVLGYVNRFNRGIARVQKELIQNGNGAAVFSVDNITVFSVNVPRVEKVSENVNEKVNEIRAKEEAVFAVLRLSDKSIKILSMCAFGSSSQGDLLSRIGITNQTNNVNNHIRPLIREGLIVKSEKRSPETKMYTFSITERGRAYLAYKILTDMERETVD